MSALVTQVKAVAAFLGGLLGVLTGVLANIDGVPGWVPITTGILTPLLAYIATYAAPANRDYTDDDVRDDPTALDSEAEASNEPRYFIAPDAWVAKSGHGEWPRVL